MLAQLKISQCVLLLMTFYSCLLGVILYRNDFNLNSFILLGDAFTTKEFPFKKIKILNNSNGYDGQFYYRLALDPFTNKKTDFGITLDQPALRQQRVLFPLLSWAVSFGRGELVPFGMLLINIFALAGCIFFSIKLVRGLNQPLWCVLPLCLYPGLLISLTRNLTEIVALFLLCGGLFFHNKNKNFLAVTFFTWACLARETTLVFPTVVAVYYFYLRLKGKLDSVVAPLNGVARSKEKITIGLCAAFALPLVVYFIWQVVLMRLWEGAPLVGNYNLNLDIPFKGLGYVFYFKTLATKLRIFEVAYLFGVIGLAAMNFKKNSNWPLKLTWILYVILFFLYSKWIWAEDYSFFRACSELFIFSYILVLSGGSRRVKKWFFYSTLAMTGLVTLKVLI